MYGCAWAAAIVWRVLCYGMWGAAGKKLYGFTKNGEFRWYYSDGGGVGYDKGYFRYDEKTHIIHVTWSDGDSGSMTVTALTPTVICLTYRRDSGENVNVFLSRIDESDHNTIGSLSLIYDKKLTLMGSAFDKDEEPMIITMTIGSNGKITSTENSTKNLRKQVFDYEYDENSHLLKISAYGGQMTDSLTVIKLTKDALILENRYIDEGKQEITLMEYREI